MRQPVYRKEDQDYLTEIVADLEKNVIINNSQIKTNKTEKS